MTCAHPPCTCPVDEGLKHCGPSCRMGIEAPGGNQCFCGHANCTNSEGEG